MSFQFQMNKKGRLIYEFEVNFKTSFIWRSNLDLDIFPWRPGLKTGVKMPCFGLRLENRRHTLTKNSQVYSPRVIQRFSHTRFLFIRRCQIPRQMEKWPVVISDTAVQQHLAQGRELRKANVVHLAPTVRNSTQELITLERSLSCS